MLIFFKKYHKVLSFRGTITGALFWVILGLFLGYFLYFSTTNLWITFLGLGASFAKFLWQFGHLRLSVQCQKRAFCLAFSSSVWCVRNFYDVVCFAIKVRDVWCSIFAQLWQKLQSGLLLLQLEKLHTRRLFCANFMSTFGQRTNVHCSLTLQFFSRSFLHKGSFLQVNVHLSVK